MKEKLLNSYLYVFDNKPYEITTEANGIYIQEEFVKEFAYINPSLASKMIPINYYVIKANTPEWYSYMVSTEPQPAPLGPDSSVPDNPELVVDGDNITVSEYGNKFMLFSNPRKLKNVMYNSTNENVAYFSSDQEGQVEIAGPGTTMLSQEFAGDDEYLPFSKSYNLEVEDITVDPEIAWSQNSATVQIGESNSFPTISNPHNVGLTFASSDESVATVDQNTGEITLVSAGNCSIACISVQDADYYSSTVEYSLTVLAAKVNPDLSWSFSPATVQIGESNSFPTLNNPDNLSPIVYSSSNQAVATVNQETGEVSLVAAGSCYITASFAGNSQYNAYTISYELTVLSAKVDPDFYFSNLTGNYDLYTQAGNVPQFYNISDVSPINFTSSDTSVATVNSDGTVNYLAVGSTTISASFAGNSTYNPLMRSYVLTISDSRPLEDNISFVDGDHKTVHPFEQFTIGVNNPDNLGWSITQQPTDSRLEVVQKTLSGIEVFTTTTPAGTYTLSITSRGSNPKTLTYTINVEAYSISRTENYLALTSTPSIYFDGYHNNVKLRFVIVNDPNNNLYTVMDTSNNVVKEYPTKNGYNSYYYLGNSLEIRDVSTGQVVPGLMFENMTHQDDNFYEIQYEVSSSYVQDDSREIMLCLKDNQPFVLTDAILNSFGNFQLTGGYTIPKEDLFGSWYDSMNQQEIYSISLSNYDLPCRDRYQLKFNDYTGNLVNELNVSDLTITSPDPGCTITATSKQTSGQDIFFNIDIDSTVNISNQYIRINTPEKTHFKAGQFSIPLTITGIKPKLKLISKNVPTEVTPGETVNASYQFEVSYGFRWDGNSYVNCWMDNKYSPADPTPTFTYDDQANITVMTVSFSSTLDSSATVGMTGGMGIQLMSNTYDMYTDSVSQTVVNTSSAIHLLSNSFIPVSDSNTAQEIFTMGPLTYLDRIKTADFSLTYTSYTAASISISNTAFTHLDNQYDNGVTNVQVSFDLAVGSGVVQGDSVNIFAQLTDNGDGYYMPITNAGSITLNPTPPTPTIDPVIYFDNSELTLDYLRDYNKLNGDRKTQSLKGANKGDDAWITWSTSDSVIATVQGHGYVIAHGNGTVNVIAEYAAHDSYNYKKVQYQLTITNYKQNPEGQWYNNGTPIDHIDVVLGGSSTYTLTFSGTPSDSWTFTIDSSSTIDGVSVDSNGTITINESQLNTLDSFNITAYRQADTSYYEITIPIAIVVQRDPNFYFNGTYKNITSGMSTDMSVDLYNSTSIDTMQYPIQWTSSSADITVDQSGFVNSSIGGATGTITATLSDGTNTHKAVCTVIVEKQYAHGEWYKDGSPYNNLRLVEGNTQDQTFTFIRTPNDSWSFYDPGLPGVSVNTTTGEITITGASVQSSESNVTANRMEDASYYSGMASLNIKVFPAGTDLTFYYEQESVNLDNQGMTTSTPMLHDEYMGLGYTKTYTSADTNVATVDAYGMISFVGAGNTTVTATTTNGTDTHTATINVYCNTMNA